MTEGRENTEAHIGKPLRLQLRDFRAGHWPGSKEPPYVLSDLFIFEHPEIKQIAKEVSQNIAAGKEALLLRAGFETPEGKQETLEIRVTRGEHPDDIYLRAYPYSDTQSRKA